MGLDFDDDRLPSTRRGVRWLVAIVAVLGAVEASLPLMVDGQAALADRALAEWLLNAAALSLPWLIGAALLGSRPRLGTAMLIGVALVSLPRQIWVLWTVGMDLRSQGRALYPALAPQTAVLVLVLLTLFLLYVSRPRGLWREKATAISRRALVPIIMALLWTLGPIVDPDPMTGAAFGELLPTFFAAPFPSPGPLAFLLLHALPVLLAGIVAVGLHRRVAGAAMMAWAAPIFLLMLGQFLTGRTLHDSSLLPLGGVTFLGLVSMFMIGQQWSTEGTRFTDPGKVPEQGQRSE